MDRKDKYMYGTTCTWHGSISETKINNEGLFCCPICSGALSELDSKEMWYDRIEKFAMRNRLPYYFMFMELCKTKNHSPLKIFNWKNEYKKFVNSLSTTQRGLV